MCPIGDNPKRVDRLPPADGRPNGTKEPMGGAVLTDDHNASAKRLGKMAPTSNGSAQPGDKLHDQDAP